jgi:hypothetical protein
MDHHQLSLSTKMPKIVSEDVQINEDNCIDDKKECHQEKAEVVSQSYISCRLFIDKGFLF